MLGKMITDLNKMIVRICQRQDVINNFTIAKVFDHFVVRLLPC